MKTAFDLSDKLKAFAEQTKKQQKALLEGIEKNAVIACNAMEQAAKEHTPHANDGKKRGWNVISDSLQSSWVAEYIPSKKKKTIGKVLLSNYKSYAKYVQNGHRVSRHFVPWLYKDDAGTLSYETNHGQPMFGLIVGTKTKYVKGIDMITPAIKAFNDTFDELNVRLIEKIFNKK